MYLGKALLLAMYKWKLLKGVWGVYTSATNVSLKSLLGDMCTQQSYQLLQSDSSTHPTTTYTGHVHAHMYMDMDMDMVHVNIRLHTVHASLWKEVMLHRYMYICHIHVCTVHHSVCVFTHTCTHTHALPTCTGILHALHNTIMYIVLRVQVKHCPLTFLLSTVTPHCGVVRG